MMNFNDVTFANPEYLWLLLSVPLVLYFRYRIYTKRRTDLVISDLGSIKSVGLSLRQRISWLPLLLRILAIILVVIGLARPQSSSKGTNVTSEGIAIVLAMDVSSSMLAEDLRPNRIEASKIVATEFIKGRPTDVIGLVVFSGESLTQCPLTKWN